MTTTPADLTLSDAAALVAGGDTTNDPAVAEALAYVVDNDIWQAGRAWVGPRATGSAPGDAMINAEIERGLAATNLARELTERAVAGVVGREPDWTLPDVADDDQAALTAWWDKRGLVGIVQEALRRALCGDPQTLRLLDPAPGPRPATLAEAFDRLAVERLDSATATVIDDPATGLLLGCAVFDAAATTLDGRLGRAVARRMAEITYVEGEYTMVRLIGESGPYTKETQRLTPDMLRAQDEPMPLRLGGRLTMHALADIRPLLTPSLLGLQRLMTLVLTSAGRNTVTAGFAERVMLNAQRPVDSDGNPLPYKVGGGITNWLVGLATESGYMNADMKRLDPTDSAAFSTTADMITFHAHKEARQLHALISGDAAPSGESRIQAEADFLAGLGPAARSTERLIRWLLETAYCWALDLRGQAPPLDLRAQVTMTLSAGAPSSDKIKEIREGVAADLLRRSRYQTAMGVDDPQAEDDAIAEEAATARERSMAGMPDAMQAQAAAPLPAALQAAQAQPGVGVVQHQQQEGEVMA